MTRKEAFAAGEMFYVGKVCKRHPELLGQRRSKSGGCPSCIRERTAKRRKKMGRKEYNLKNRERYAAIKAGDHVPRKYRKEKATSAIARADG